MKKFFLVAIGALLCGLVLGGGNEKEVKEKKNESIEGLLAELTNRVDDLLSSSKWFPSFDHYTFNHFPSPAAPKYKIADDEKKFEVTYENLVGYGMNEIEIKLEPNRVLRLHGEHTSEGKEGSKSSTSFNHAFKLSQYADVDHIAADMTSDGKLTVMVPKLDKPKPLRTIIPIQRLDTKATE